MLSTAMEDYLKAIYVLQSEEGPPVATSAIAEYLEKTPPTVTSMMEKLADRGLIEREKYRGVELSEEGRTVALEVIRHHRIVEAYLAEHLDYDWADVHEEADTLEHHISEELERRMAALLEDPETDPHGDPIPTESLEPVEESGAARLAEFEEGDRVVVSRVPHRNQEELDYLSAAGITPGTELELIDVAPFGMVTVRLVERGDEQSLPEEIAESIRVRDAVEELA
ncbi:metal-dependent transcriptional regulator [Halolamina sp.]|jgi:DtxR family Mn-dependent transcriptional regulator|uniref:metal-dependent transcriptional regulator n=1 Tax=Halolamina sp. TaxID=1940283 RepID=UPI000223BAE7|nr:iron (metal) dependent repressor, DtxR family [halophilic archaeon DL31]